MSNKLIAISLMLVLMWPLTAGDKRSVERYNGPTKDLTTLRSINGVGTGLYVIGSDADYDAVLTENNAMAASTNFGVGRGTADTLQYVPADGAWNGQFIQSPGDAMLVMYQMPADAIIKGLNVPLQFPLLDISFLDPRLQPRGSYKISPVRSSVRYRFSQ